MDSTMQNKASDRGQKFNEEETKEKIRRNCREQLIDPERKIFLLSKMSPITVEAGKRKVDVTFPDNHMLKTAVLQSFKESNGQP